MALQDAVSTVSSSSSSPYSSSSSSGAWTAGLCLGAICGAGLALLFAPRSGSELRSSLRSLASSGSGRIQQLTSSGSHWADDTIHSAMNLIEQGRQAFCRFREGGVNSSSLRPRGVSSDSSSGYSSSESSISSDVSVNSGSPLTASIGERQGMI